MFSIVGAAAALAACGSSSPTAATKTACGDVQGDPVVVRVTNKNWQGATAVLDEGRTVYTDTANVSGVMTPVKRAWIQSTTPAIGRT